MSQCIFRCLLVHSACRRNTRVYSRAPLCWPTLTVGHVTPPTVIQKHLIHIASNRLLARDNPNDNLSLAEKQLSVRQSDVFEDVARRKKVKNKETYGLAVEKFKKRNPLHRHHVEFIYAALDTMKDFRVEKDIAVYKELISVFPTGKFVVKNKYQASMKHAPKQQDCMIALLNKMMDEGVMPDTETGQMIINIFGQGTHAFRMYQRLMYWMPKARHANPYPWPVPMPTDPKQVAAATLDRMAVDMENRVTVFQVNEVEGHETGAETFVASAQSPIQQELISELSTDAAVVVEGPFRSYIAKQLQTYYVLRTDTTQRYKRYQEVEQDEDDTKFQFTTMFQEEDYVDRPVPPSKHEQNDGTILAMCVPGAGAHRPALLAWIKWMEKDNPRLAQVPVLFQIESEMTDGGGQLQAYTGQADKHETIEKKALKEIFKDRKR